MKWSAKLTPSRLITFLFLKEPLYFKIHSNYPHTCVYSYRVQILVASTSSNTVVHPMCRAKYKSSDKEVTFEVGDIQVIGVSHHEEHEEKGKLYFQICGAESVQGVDGFLSGTDGEEEEEEDAYINVSIIFSSYECEFACIFLIFTSRWVYHVFCAHLYSLPIIAARRTSFTTR